MEEQLIIQAIQEQWQQAKTVINTKLIVTVTGLLKEDVINILNEFVIKGYLEEIIPNNTKPLGNVYAGQRYMVYSLTDLGKEKLLKI